MQAVFRIDPHAAHRARLRPHSGPADRALQRRPGGSGPRKEVFPTPERQLSVRSHVEKNRRIVSGVQIGQQEAGRDIAAQIVGHRRHTENIAVKRQSQLTCGMHARIEKDWRIGALEDLPRFAAEQQMHHRRVSRSAQRRDLLRPYSRLLTALRDQAADALQHQLLQMPQMLRLVLRVENAVKDIVSDGALPVEAARARKHRAVRQMQQLHFQRCRPDIERQRKKALRRIARLHTHQLPARVRRAERHGHAASAVPDRRIEHLKG